MLPWIRFLQHGCAFFGLSVAEAEIITEQPLKLELILPFFLKFNIFDWLYITILFLFKGTTNFCFFCCLRLGCVCVVVVSLLCVVEKPNTQPKFLLFSFFPYRPHDPHASELSKDRKVQGGCLEAKGEGADLSSDYSPLGGGHFQWLSCPSLTVPWPFWVPPLKLAYANRPPTLAFCLCFAVVCGGGGGCKDSAQLCIVFT